MTRTIGERVRSLMIGAYGRVMRVRAVRLPLTRGALASAWARALSDGRVEVSRPARRIGPASVWAARGSSVRVGGDSVLVSSRGWNPVEPARRCSIRAIVPGASIVIGEGFRATGATIVARDRITIGDDVLLGSDVLVVDSDFHALDAYDRAHGAIGMSSPVRIGDGVFIGARSIVLKGVTIGDGAVIGAGAVVVGDIPDGAVAAGNPAKVVRIRKVDE